ncbi:MAG: ATP synthase F1 subunit delta [Oscillospiraceae bacterium]|nr:ATP synthase F1 subunit delta [Oscillospiraceae bacterium]
MAELSVRYATALFDLAAQSGEIEKYVEQAGFLCDALKDEELQRIITHPKVSTSSKLTLLRESFAGRIFEDLLGLLYLAVEKRREAFLIPALTEFISLVHGQTRKTTAKVVASKQLDDRQVESLEKFLSEKLSKQVEVSVRVDPSVLGGFSVHVDDFLIDNTIKKRLSDMKNSIKRSMIHDS